MSIYDGGPSLQKEAATYAKYAAAYAVAITAAADDADTPFARLYRYVMRARAEIGVFDDGGALDAVIKRLMTDVFIVGHAHAVPKIAAGAHEFDQVFDLLRTYAAYARQKQQAYARILATGAPARDSAFCASMRPAYYFAGQYTHALWSLQRNEHEYDNMRAYVCFLLGLYTVCIPAVAPLPPRSAVSVTAPPPPSAVPVTAPPPAKKRWYKFWNT